MELTAGQGRRFEFMSWFGPVDITLPPRDPDLPEGPLGDAPLSLTARELVQSFNTIVFLRLVAECGVLIRVPTEVADDLWYTLTDLRDLLVRQGLPSSEVVPDIANLCAVAGRLLDRAHGFAPGRPPKSLTEGTVRLA